VNTPKTEASSQITLPDLLKRVSYGDITNLSVLPKEIGLSPHTLTISVGELDLADGRGMTSQTNLGLFHFNNLFDTFAHDYRLWVPASIDPHPPYGSALEDVADALGSTNNPYVMSNLERALNVSILLTAMLYHASTITIHSSSSKYDLSFESRVVLGSLWTRSSFENELCILIVLTWTNRS
jgi:hypothetical protein